MNKWLFFSIAAVCITVSHITEIMIDPDRHKEMYEIRRSSS